MYKVNINRKILALLLLLYGYNMYGMQNRNNVDIEKLDQYQLDNFKKEIDRLRKIYINAADSSKHIEYKNIIHSNRFRRYMQLLEDTTIVEPGINMQEVRLFIDFLKEEYNLSEDCRSMELVMLSNSYINEILLLELEDKNVDSDFFWYKAAKLLNREAIDYYIRKESHRKNISKFKPYGEWISHNVIEMYLKYGAS